jgi:hypothetical protein
MVNDVRYDGDGRSYFINGKKVLMKDMVRLMQRIAGLSFSSERKHYKKLHDEMRAEFHSLPVGGVIEWSVEYL